MKELYTNITLRNGETKSIKVELEDELADWIITQPEDVYRDFLIFEYKSKCIERKETRRTQSLTASIDNGFDIVDEDAEVHTAFLRKLTCEQVREAIKKLKPKQQWVAEQMFLLERKQVEVAKELGISEPAIAQQMAIIRRDLKNILKKI